MKLFKFYLIFFLFFEKNLFALDFSVGASLGATSYNPGFYVKSSEKNVRKLIPAPLFAPLFNLHLDLNLSQYWRLGFTGSFRYPINFKTYETELHENKKVSAASGLQTSSVSFHICYEFFLSMSYKSFFGLGGGYSKTWLKDFTTNLKLENGDNLQQKVPGKNLDAFIFKIIVGQSVELAKDFCLEILFEFSPIEWLVTKETASVDDILESKTGIWSFKPPYEFPLRPLDISLGVRKKFSF